MVVTPVVAIVGRPNVGKSTLFNRLASDRQAITADTPGTTRDANYRLIEWVNRYFWLVDTAGLASASDELDEAVQDQIKQVTGQADTLIVVADGSGPVTNEDRKAAKLALKTRQPVILALNKIDAAGGQTTERFAELGIKEMVPLTALHGRGTGDLLDVVTATIKSSHNPPAAADLTISLLGRPNVGKSTLFNQLLKRPEALISKTAGTTRDTNSRRLKYQGKSIEVVDTAGMRRRGKMAQGLEQFSFLRTMRAINASDVAILVIDATEASVALDQQIAGLVKEAGKGLIVVVNKIDQLPEAEAKARLTNLIEADFRFVWWSPLVFTSAVSGLNVLKILELADQIAARRQTKLPTAKLNRIISALTLAKPPAGLRGRQPKINYATQTGVAPPTFRLFSSHPGFIHFSYQRYLENGLRQAIDLIGTPIRLEFKDKRGAKV